jgi:hypothetical protein
MLAIDVLPFNLWSNCDQQPHCYATQGRAEFAFSLLTPHLKITQITMAVKGRKELNIIVNGF